MDHDLVDPILADATGAIDGWSALNGGTRRWLGPLASQLAARFRSIRVARHEAALRLGVILARGCRRCSGA